MKLIDDWKQSYRLNSVQLAAALVVANIAVCFLPLLQNNITPFAYAAANAVLGSLIIVLRLKSQAAPVESA